MPGGIGSFFKRIGSIIYDLVHGVSLVQNLPSVPAIRLLFENLLFGKENTTRVTIRNIGSRVTSQSLFIIVFPLRKGVLRLRY